MRVTGGALAGRRIDAPRRGTVRPTADRVRESLFMRLGSQEGSRVLDLFAGSGALGIEALSRGATSVVFVDRTAVCAATIRRNLEALEVGDRARVLRSPVKAALQRLARERARFDLVLVDPPYAAGEAQAVLEAVAREGLLDPAGTLVLETDRRHDPDPVAGLRRTDERRYGDTQLIWFAPEGDTSQRGGKGPAPSGDG